jgi:ParB-like chromosome segregation protein Spo0J
MTDETIIPITALELDPRNARKRTPRSSKVIGESLQEFGPLRSLVGQRLPDGRIVVRAGNGTLEEAGQIGIDKVRIVERRPDELVVVVADDLDETQWTRYAIADNRASDLSTWDAEVLEILDQEIDLEPFFLGDELNALMAGLAGDSEGLVVDDGVGQDEWANALGKLPDGDRSPFQQMTFTLHDDQVEQVKAALDCAKKMGAFDSENENSNGNALSRVCEIFLTNHGNC